MFSQVFSSFIKKLPLLKKFAGEDSIRTGEEMKLSRNTVVRACEDKLNYDRKPRAVAGGDQNTTLSTATPYEIDFFAESKKADLEDLLKVKIDPLPQAVARVSSLLRDENVSTHQLAEAVSCDLSLTTRLLQLANSPYYALMRNVTTVHQAIEAVGTKTLYEIVMLDSTAHSFSREIRDSVMGRLCWEHSLAVALLAREISSLLRLRGTEDSFLCGLLHDIGRIIMLRADIDRFTELFEINDENYLLRREAELFGYTHEQIGAIFCDRWGLPEAVSHVIFHHHSPAQAYQSFTMAHVIRVADIASNTHGYGLMLEEDSALLELDSMSFLKLTPEQVAAAWENIQEGLQDILTAFKG